MRIGGAFLRSKVARRVLLLFVLSAFIPILFFAVLYYKESNRLLVKQAHTQLEGASVMFGTSVYDRLLLADQLLRNAADDLASDNSLKNTRERVGTTFRSLALLSPRKRAISVFGDPFEVPAPSEAAVAHLRRGEAVLTSRETSGHDRKVLLIRALTPLAADLRLVAAEIDAGYLWGKPETFPFMTDFCVLDEAYAPLFCSHRLRPNLIVEPVRRSSGSSKGQFTWEEHQQKYLADYRELFLQAKFFAPGWIVVASQPEVVALGPISTFKTIFWGSVVLSVLLVMLLSMTQIRRTLVPLGRLIEGTRRLAGNDFGTKVDVVSDDEFGELAGSFNSMAARLGRQFDTLTTLSKIDRAILSELDIDRIVEDVLVRLRENFKAGCASISVIDHDSPDKVRTYAVANDGERPPVERRTLSADARETLLAHPTGLWMSGETARQTMEGCLEKLGAQRFFTLPIIWKDQLVGVVCLGYRASATLSEEDIAHIRDYADRVGVALSTAAREDQLYQQARTDALTGLPNRFHFMDRLKQDIAQARREGRNLAVLFTDLDRFKSINDSLGHAAGDELLREAAVRLRQCVRESDTVARLGGDEFTILINPLTSAEGAGTVAEHALAALSEPFLIESVVTASIGITVYPSDGASAEELMRNADTAMYRAKDSGRGGYVFFEDAMNAEVVRRSTLERELRHAISEQQFVLHYQPQIELRTGRVRGAEALVRWRHPERGIIGANEFIVIAEETGLISAIGHIVLVEACAQYRAWREKGINLDYVAVNVSSRQFRQPDFVQTVETALRTNNMPAECLKLEITESVLLDGADAVVDMLARLKSLGVQISIDDFGTGYSSMAYLERIPFDILKIDMSFIQKIREDGKGGVIAATIVAMAHALGKEVVAEGVETQAQIDFLRKVDCELIQGYYYSRPLPEQELEEFVNKRQLPGALSASG